MNEIAEKQMRALFQDKIDIESAIENLNHVTRQLQDGETNKHKLLASLCTTAHLLNKHHNFIGKKVTFQFIDDSLIELSRGEIKKTILLSRLEKLNRLLQKYLARNQQGIDEVYRKNKHQKGQIFGLSDYRKRRLQSKENVTA